MKVRFSSEVDVSSDELFRIFKHELENLTGGAFFKDDILYENDEYYHGSVTDSPVKNPTAIQEAAVRLRDELKKVEQKRWKAEEKRNKELRKS